VHNKQKKQKEKPQPTFEDERRCEEVAQLLLEGKKGDELAAAMRSLDRDRVRSSRTPGDNQPTPPGSASSSSFIFPHHNLHGKLPRRSSSVPLPNDIHPIALPSVPFFAAQENLTRASRIWLGQRRASSAGPIGAARSWVNPLPPAVLQRDSSPLPEADTSLFDPLFFTNSNFGFFPQDVTNVSYPLFLFFDFANLALQPFADFLTSSIPPNIGHHPLGLSQSISPLDYANTSTGADYTKVTTTTYPSVHEFAPAPPPITVPPNTATILDTPVTSSTSWLQTPSDPSSLYSGSPAPDEMTLPVHAPQPQHLTSGGTGSFEAWKDFTGSTDPTLFAATTTTMPVNANDVSLHLNALDMSVYAHSLPPSTTTTVPVQGYGGGAVFDPASYSMNSVVPMGPGASAGMMNDMTTMMGFAIHESY
jgi:hypothetical protein